jgi:hypothetical protein
MALGDSEEDKKKGALEDIKNVIKDFGKEIGDALATNISVDNITEKLLEVDVAAKQIAKSFGLGADNIVNLKAAMTEAVTEVTLLGGSFADVAKIQQQVGESLGRNVTLASEAYGGLHLLRFRDKKWISSYQSLKKLAYQLTKLVKKWKR